MPRFRVICDWLDGCNADADEVVVTAKTAGGATSKARAAWLRRQSRSQYPDCRLEKVWVLTKKRAKEFA